MQTFFFKSPSLSWALEINDYIKRLKNLKKPDCKSISLALACLEKT